MAKKWSIGNVEGYTKWIIGMCADEKPHTEIAQALWKLLKGIRSTDAHAEFRNELRKRRAS